MFKFKEIENEDSLHPFSELVEEFGEIIIQKGNILIPKKDSFEAQYKPIGKVCEFEEAYLETASRKDLQEKIITNPHLIFLHRVMKEYLTNELTTSTKTIWPQEYLDQNSPFKNKPTTAITSHEILEYGGNETTVAKDEHKKINTVSHFKTRSYSPSILSESYARLAINFQNRNQLVTEYSPVLGTKHKKVYFGKNAAKKEIEIVRKNLSQYQIKTYCPPSKMIHNGVELCFDEVYLTTNINIIKDKMNLTSYPTAPKGYEHVFVHQSGNICFNGSERFADIGLRTSMTPLSIHSHHTVNKLKQVLDEGHVNLQYGFKDALTYATQPSTIVEKRKAYPVQPTVVPA